MEKMIEKYLRYLKIERNASVHTITSYKNDLTSLIIFQTQFEIPPSYVDINLITRLTLRLWLGNLSEEGLAKSSIARKVAALKSFFKYCFKRGYIEKNPAHLLVIPKKEKTLPKTVTPDDIVRLLESIDISSPQELQDRAILEILYSTGIRVSELVSLNILDVDLTSSQISVIGKGNKQRMIPIGSTAHRIIKEFLMERSKLYGKRTDADAHRALF